jgi:hypothetical protein
MNKYHVYHPFGGAINTFCERGVYEFQEVANVFSDSLSGAWKQAQNDFNEEYAALGIRSTCIGDIIQNVAGTCYMVTSDDFVEVPINVLQYIDWGNHMTTTDEEMSNF